jgi:hypothetical protein
LHRGSQLVERRDRVESRKVAFESASHLESKAGCHTLESGLDVAELVAAREEALVVDGDLDGRRAKHVVFEAIRQQRPDAATEIARQGSRIGAEDAEDEIHERHGSLRGIRCVPSNVLGKGDVPKHAKERQHREGDEAPCLLSRNTPHELEHLGVRDAIELRSELERVERIEVRRLGDLTLRDGEERVEQPKRNARKSRQPGGHLEKIRHRVAKDEQRLLRRVLSRRFANEAPARAIVG